MSAFAEKKTKRILATVKSEGKKHDYAPFKEKSSRLKSESRLLLDVGFIGVKAHFTNAVRHKASKLHPLTRE
jgi:hypothetical protein